MTIDEGVREIRKICDDWWAAVTDSENGFHSRVRSVLAAVAGEMVERAADESRSHDCGCKVDACNCRELIARAIEAIAPPSGTTGGGS